MIDGSTKFLGLIGQDISYTLSPLLHNTALRQLGINGAYLPFDVPESTLAPLLAVAWDAGAMGFSITRPHKSALAALVPGHGLSSINTLYRGNQGWLGASTDGSGFVAGLAHIRRELKDFTQIFLLGSGGAAKAVLSHVRQLMPRMPITILRRSDHQDRILQEVAGQEPLSLCPFTPDVFAARLAGSDPHSLVIQATDGPRGGDDLSTFVTGFRGYRGCFVDLIYGAHTSALLATAKALGLPSSDGLPMLIEQARQSQSLWWGRSASYQSLEAALELRTL